MRPPSGYADCPRKRSERICMHKAAHGMCLGMGEGRALTVGMARAATKGHSRIS